MQNQLLERTRFHYDEYHFIEGGSNRIAWWREYLRDFLPDEDIRDRLIVDVGSSIGEISRGLIDRNGRLVCLDISLQSLRRCRELNPEADIFHGNALELPFPDNTFDHAISIGVLHHTPDCRRGFAEVARITAQGGTIVIFLYNFWNIYNLIYHAFKPVRAAVPLDRIPSWTLGVLQPFVQSHLHQELNTEELRNLLGDKLWTPQATFHTVSQVRRWGTEEGLRLVAVKRFYLGYANVMRFEKVGASDRSARRQVSVKCLNCGSSPMRKSEEGYRCGHCGNVYGLDGGITRCVVS
jgi:ubiquinone/menaquinone biosynthesis C-methylase UbiE